MTDEFDPFKQNFHTQPVADITVDTPSKFDPDQFTSSKDVHIFRPNNRDQLTETTITIDVLKKLREHLSQNSRFSQFRSTILLPVSFVLLGVTITTGIDKKTISEMTAFQYIVCPVLFFSIWSWHIAMINKERHDSSSLLDLLPKIEEIENSMFNKHDEEL